MSLITMRDEVIAKFGADSFEAGYIQYSFSHHSTDWFIGNYKRLMDSNYTKVAFKTVGQKVR